jgi:hypothetical protein
LKNEQGSFGDLQKCRHEKAIHIQHGGSGNSTCAGIALARLHSVGKCAMNHFVQRLNLDGGYSRQNDACVLGM